MKLFKNIDVAILDKVLKEGILPISKTGNNDWEKGRRGDDSMEAVYLFGDIKSNVNSFPKSYGIVLLEVEVEATLNEMAFNDVHREDYAEYICKEVKPREIKKIYIPKIFSDRVKEYLTEETFKKVTFVDIEGKVYEKGYTDVTEKHLELFANTARISVEEFNFFRGKKEDRTLFDIYDVHYNI